MTPLKLYSPEFTKSLNNDVVPEACMSRGNGAFGHLFRADSTRAGYFLAPFLFIPLPDLPLVARHVAGVRG